MPLSSSVPFPDYSYFITIFAGVLEWLSRHAEAFKLWRKIASLTPAIDLFSLRLSSTGFEVAHPVEAPSPRILRGENVSHRFSAD